MLDAAEQIRAELAAEARSRTVRALLLLVVLMALGLGFAFGTGLKASMRPGDLLAATVAVGFVLLGISASATPQRRFGDGMVLAIAGIAFASPILAATGMGALGGFGCLIAIVAVGAVALVATRLVLSGKRRRFGGATQLQGVAAALAAALGVGLHCPMPTAVHLLTHAAAALLVGAVLRRLVLR